MQKKCLALDIGEKRIGVAVGSTIPFGRGVIDATDVKVALMKIKDIIATDEIQKIVIGLPQVKSGEVTASQKIVHEWRERLKFETDLPIELIDESYSSIAAESELRANHIDTKQEKWRIDERAAELILEQYLGSQK
jgi:putative Holliday junction resolvase